VVSRAGDAESWGRSGVGRDMARKAQTEPEGREQEIRSAISAFEQILEAMPEDRASLEALAHAYAQIGDRPRATEYLVRLGNALIREKDLAGARTLVERIEAVDAPEPPLAELLDRLRAFAEAERGGETGPGVAAASGAAGVRTGVNMSEELAFVWKLMEAEKISQDDYAAIVHDLTEMSAGGAHATVSVLHVLEARGFKNLEKIMSFVAKDCGTPFIRLSNFELQVEAISLVPMDFMLRCGALVFGLIGQDALTVVLNPYDRDLRKDVEALVGRPCHFFVTLASEFDTALDRISDVLVETGPAAADQG